MSARNALCMDDLYIHSSDLWKPKPNGASGCGCAERHLRADTQVCPYGLVVIINSRRKRLQLCRNSTFSTAPRYNHLVRLRLLLSEGGNVLAL